MKRLFVITILARPREGSTAFQEFGGAYVNAWIDAASESAAIAAAERKVQTAGWVVEAIEETAHLQRSDYGNADPSLRYFDQALIDREVLVFHSWPIEAQDEDVLH